MSAWSGTPVLLQRLDPQTRMLRSAMGPLIAAALADPEIMRCCSIRTAHCGSPGWGALAFR